MLVRSVTQLWREAVALPPPGDNEVKVSFSATLLSKSHSALAVLILVDNAKHRLV